MVKQDLKKWFSFRVDVSEENQNEILRWLGLYCLENNIQFWFMRKKDKVTHLRLRFYLPEEFVMDDLKSILNITCNEREGISVIYEPEVFLFGGDKGMDIAHLYFIENTKLYTEYLQCQKELSNTIGGIELFLWISNFIVTQTNLDKFEIWDVWKRIDKLRFVEYEKIKSIVDSNKLKIETILSMSVEEVFARIKSSRFREVFEKSVKLFSYLGEELFTLNIEGELTRGIRGILSCIVIFNWNMIGFSPGIQAGLAKMVTVAKDPDKEVTVGE
ncbi:thiopeptide-type bacteriocin biosynthesis protein [Bacillus cereus group sp. TH260-2LC]|uniref:thiopeptide-type bacteriocin biosynthesis protein n=1 Tax=Bacillus TaxID=1386 RepID=UPI001587AF62|nr:MULTISPECIES: thiopeptide-type bacteriocin biosynthesis protein [Bacillus]MDA1526826.1 thiopeptide-type bacteriocin biosynthesis protein [Bacillus cereus group sp. TH260-2LC]